MGRAGWGKDPEPPVEETDTGQMTASSHWVHVPPHTYTAQRQESSSDHMRFIFTGSGSITRNNYSVTRQCHWTQLNRKDLEKEEPFRSWTLLSLSHTNSFFFENNPSPPGTWSWHSKEKWEFRAPRVLPVWSHWKLGMSNLFSFPL